MTAEVVNAIVLGTQRYSERGIVVQLYTREYGRLGVISYAGRSSDGTRLTSYCRVLSVLRVIIRQGRHAGSMPQLVGVEDWTRGAYGPLDCARMAVAGVIGELLQRLLTEPARSDEMYEFIAERVGLLEAGVVDEVPFLMVFLLGLSIALGYGPSGACTSSTPYFKLSSGEFCQGVGVDAGDFISREDSAIWGRMLLERYRVDLRDVGSAQRYRVLQQELRYLEIHSGARLQLKSLPVLQELVG